MYTVKVALKACIYLVGNLTWSSGNQFVSICKGKHFKNQALFCGTEKVGGGSEEASRGQTAVSLKVRSLTLL